MIDYLNFSLLKSALEIRLSNVLPTPSLGAEHQQHTACTRGVELWPTAETVHLASQLHKLQIDIPEQIYNYVEFFQMRPEEILD